jgi:HK97 family phage portal protein
MAVSKVGTLFNAVTSGIKTPGAWLMESLGLANKSSAGITITPHSVLGIPEVWSSVSKISGHLSQIPVNCRKLDASGVYSEVQRSDAGHRVLANPDQTGVFTHQYLFEKWLVDALILGNGRIYIDRSANGTPQGLYPLPADSSVTVMVNGERYHRVTLDIGTTVAPLSAGESGTTFTIPDKDVLYLMGLTENGYWGLNPCEILADTFGLAIAGQEATGSTYRNAGRPGMLLEAPTGAFPTSKDAQEFMDNFNAAHEGMSQRGKTALIKDGMKAHLLNQDANASSYTIQRQFNRESVAAVFLIETVFGDNSGSTYKSITERQASYITNCLSRWITKMEEQFNAKLLSGRQKNAGGFFYKMDTSYLYRHDRMSVAQYTNSLVTQKAVTVDEVREMHGLRPHGGLSDQLPEEIAEERSDKALEQKSQEAGNPSENDENTTPEPPNRTEEKE